MGRLDGVSRVGESRLVRRPGEEAAWGGWVGEARWMGWLR